MDSWTSGLGNLRLACGMWIRFQSEILLRLSTRFFPRRTFTPPFTGLYYGLKRGKWEGESLVISIYFSSGHQFVVYRQEELNYNVWTAILYHNAHFSHIKLLFYQLYFYSCQSQLLAKMAKSTKLTNPFLSRSSGNKTSWQSHLLVKSSMSA